MTLDALKVGQLVAILRQALDSPLRNVVLHHHRLARHQVFAHAGFEFMVGHRGAGALVQVVGPRR